MPKLTTADLRYQIHFTDNTSSTVQIIVADRAAADAISRKHGYPADAHELRMYVAAYAAAHRVQDRHADSWPDFATQTVSVDLVDADGRPVTADGSGAYIVDEDCEDIDEDPTRLGL